MKNSSLSGSAVFLLLFFFNTSTAQINPPPVVGSTSNFLLFSSAGDVTNAGTTSVYEGGVGTNAGTLTGFGSLIQQPAHLYDATTETAQCNLDLNILYNDLAARTGIIRAGVYGSETITPGVYITGGAVNIASDLTLDGGGDPNARFIIKTGGAFTMAATAKMLLTNGTQARNVFWVIAGACAIAANCEAKGTFVCHTGAISIGANCSMEGGALTIAGAITTLDGMLLSLAIPEFTNSMFLSQNQTIANGTMPNDLVLIGNGSPVIKWQSATNSSFSNPTDILHYSNILSGACMGMLTVNTFYRAVILIDNLTAYSNTVKITTIVAPPNTGAAGPFVLFTSAGAITNSGNSPSYSGNIGTQAGAITGFTNPSDSSLHTDDFLTLACKNYLQELFDIVTAFPTTDPNHPADFGGGEILLPGVYTIGTAATMSGVLSLNGQNNPNATFVVKITGALALAAMTKIKLINGASPSNVFWIIDGALAIGANSIVAGNFICEAGAIAIGDSSLINGRIFTIAGAITMANNIFTFATVNNTFIPINNTIIASGSQVINYATQPTDISITGTSNPIIRWEKSVDIFFTNPISITNTSATLTGSQIGPLTATTYFRAITISDALITSSTIAIISLSGITITGIIDANQLICIDSIPADLILSGNSSPVVKWQSALTPDFAIPTDINSNNTTLSGNTIGLLNVTTFFRAAVQNCSYDVIYSAPIVITIDLTTSTNGGASWSNGLPSINKSIVFNGSIGSISSNLSACSIRIMNNAVVTVLSGFDLTLNGKLTVDAGSTFIVENNANLIQNTEVANTGNIIIKRNSSLIKRLDYTLWSSPVAGQGLYAFSPYTLPSRFYTYNTTTNLYENSVGFNLTGLQYPSPLVAPNGINGTDTNNVTFAAAKGYLIRTPWDHPTVPTVWNGSFNGVPNNGNISLPMTTGYNAVGNPYPSRLNIEDFIDGNPNITGSLYCWRKTNDNTAPSYATLTKMAYVANGAEGGDTGTGYFNFGNEINAVFNIGQGFIVNATSNSTLHFTNAMRRDSNANQFFKIASTENSVNNGLYWLNLTNSAGIFSQMAVGYSSAGTLADDRGIDGKNINNEFYLTSLIGADAYSIQGRPDFQAGDIVPLSYKTIAAGNYTISIDHTSGAFSTGLQPIYLKDKLTSVLHDLNTGNYSFTSVVGTFTDRFEIVYQTALGINNATFNTNDIIIHNQKNLLVVNSGTVIMKGIKVFDISGRLLLEIKDINASQTTIDTSLKNQVSLVQITSVDGLTVTKKVLQ